MRQFASMWALCWMATMCAQRPVEQWRVLYNAGSTAGSAALGFHLYDVTGNSYHVGAYGATTPVVLSLDAQGTLRWKHRWDLPGIPVGAQQRPDGNLMVFLSNGILHYTPQGELIRAERLQLPPPPGFQSLVTAAVDTQGNRYLLFGSPRIALQVIVVRTNAEGELLWTYSMPNRYAFDIFVDSEGGVIVLGGIPSESFPGAYFPEFIRLSASGNLLWRSQGDTLPLDRGRIVGETPQGQIMIATGTSLWLVSRTNGTWTRVNGWLPPRSFFASASWVMLSSGRFAAAIRYNHSDELFTFYSAAAMHEPNGALRWSAAPLGLLQRGWEYASPALAAAPNSDSLWFLTPDRSVQPTQYKLIRFDANGGVEWTRTRAIPVGASFETYGLLAFPDGESLSLWREGDALRAVRYDGTGNLRFDQVYTFTEPTRDSATVVPDGAGGVYACIIASPIFELSFHSRLQRYDGQGNLLWEVEEDTDAIQSSGAGDLFAMRLRDNEAVVSRYAPSGALVWQQRYPMSERSSTPLLIGSDDSIFILGYQQTADNRRLPHILKIGFDGTLRWTHTVSETAAGPNLPGIASPDGGLYAAIYLQPSAEWRILRYEADGRLAWVETFRDTNDLLMGVDAQSRLTVAASIRVGTENQVVIRRYALTGTQLWQLALPGRAWALQVADSGACYLIVQERDAQTLYALSDSGVLHWRRTLSETASFNWTPSLDAAGNLYLYAMRWLTPHRFDNQVAILCYRPDGTQEWATAFAGPMGYINTAKLLVQPDGRRFVLSGATVTETGGQDAYIVQYAVPQRGDANNDGCVNDADLLVVLRHFGGTSEDADLNSDGIVDDTDLLTVLFNFGSGC